MTLAALKRELKVGTVIECLPGHVQTWSVGVPRTVRIAQTNAIAVDLVDKDTGKVVEDKVSWLYWPKASEVVYDADAGTFTVNGSMSYRIVR